MDPTQPNYQPAGNPVNGASILLGNQYNRPSDYYTPYADNQQIQGYVRQGMAGVNQAAPQLDPSQQAQWRQMQMQQAQQLQGIASGQQQGAGELAVQRQVANAQAAQQAQAMMVRGGGNAGLAMRNAANNQASIGLGGAGQAQQAALSDQQMAQGQLAGALGAGRGADINMAGQNANLTQQQYGLNTQRGLGYLGQLTGMDQGQLSAQAGMYGAAQSNKSGGLLGGAMSVGGQVLGAVVSDERLKIDIIDGGGEIDDMLDKLAAKSYRYKDPKHGEGRRPGIMAQDAQKSKAGSSFVIEAPDGKMLDVNRALSAALASSARLNARLRKLEGKAA